MAWRDLISVLGTEIKNHQNSYYSNNNHKNFCNALHSKKSQVLLLPSLGLYAQCLARSNDPIPYKGRDSRLAAVTLELLLYHHWNGEVSQSIFAEVEITPFRMLASSWLYDWIFCSYLHLPHPLHFLPGNQLAVDTKDNLLLLLNSKVSRQRKKQNTSYCSCPFSPSVQRNQLQGLQGLDWTLQKKFKKPPGKRELCTP